MKKWIIGALLATGFSVLAGSSGMPVEKMALPVMDANCLVCVWDEETGSWAKGHQTYDNSGTFSLQIPQWGRWYWIGLWNTQTKQYVFGKWVGHFKTD